MNKTDMQKEREGEFISRKQQSFEQTSRFCH